MTEFNDDGPEYSHRARLTLRKLADQVRPIILRHEVEESERLCGGSLVPLKRILEKNRIAAKELLKRRQDNKQLPESYDGLLDLFFKNSQNLLVPQAVIDDNWTMLNAMLGGPQQFENLWYNKNHALLCNLPPAKKYKRIKSLDIPVSRQLLELATAIKYDFEQYMSEQQPGMIEAYKDFHREGGSAFTHYMTLDFSGRTPSEIIYQEARKIALRDLNRQWAHDDVSGYASQLREQSHRDIAQSKWRKANKNEGHSH